MPQTLKNIAWGYRDNYGKDFPLDELLWWKIDENHHQAVIVYPSEEVANAERSKLEETRSRSSQDNNNIMVEEFVGPIVMQLTAL